MCQSPCRSITKKAADGYKLEVLNIPLDQRSALLHFSQYRAEKNTNAIQYVGMLELVKCCFVITQRHETCVMPFYRRSSTVDDFGSMVDSALSLIAYIYIYANAFIRTCIHHVNNNVRRLLSHSNDE